MSFFSGLLGPIGTAVGTFFGGPAGGAIGGAIGSAIGGTQSQNETNQQNQQNFNTSNAFNAEQAQINRQFQSDQAGRQMDFQERMADTTWQRAVGDMKAAGLNPMLAYTQGGNPAPMGASGGGSQASAGALPKIEPVATTAASSAAAWSQIANTIKTGNLIDAQVDKTKADTTTSIATAKNLDQASANMVVAADKMRSEITNINADTLNKGQQFTLYTAQQKLTEVQADLEAHRITAVDAQAKLTKIQAVLTAANINVATTQAGLNRALTTQSGAATYNLNAQGDLAKNSANLKALDIPRAENEAATQDTWWKRNVSPYLPDLLKSSAIAGTMR